MRRLNFYTIKVVAFVIIVVALTVITYYFGYGIDATERNGSIHLGNIEEDSCTDIRFVRVKSSMLPDDEDNLALDALDEDEIMEIYWKYINTHETTCSNQKRFGVGGDGGKEICLDSIYQPRQPCLVYSFGSNFHFGFEEEVFKQFKCEIHTFDPSQPIGDHYIPSILTFHLIGLDGRNWTNEVGWKMLTLSEIRKLLNHANRVIDILKIDIEGSEWHSLPNMFETGVLKYVKQLSMELHFGRSKPEKWQKLWGDVAVKEQLKIIRQLQREGFRLFNHEYVDYSTMKFKKPHGCITNQNEISLVNINFR